MMVCRKQKHPQACEFLKQVEQTYFKNASLLTSDTCNVDFYNLDYLPRLLNSH